MASKLHQGQGVAKTYVTSSCEIQSIYWTDDVWLEWLFTVVVCRGVACTYTAG